MTLITPRRLPPLTDEQVRAGARPGETWAEARRRLEALNVACPAPQADDHPGADYTLAGPVDECEGLDGRPIEWEPGELSTATQK
ncbi:hypothetical protein ACOAL9_34355 [Pseudomonas aeruginosa]|uniref:hypothetical protein n=1 Tax=Pseudomonas aeruginosa TaxID=287 RepID=UPI003B283E18